MDACIGRYESDISEYINVFLPERIYRRVVSGKIRG